MERKKNQTKKKIVSAAWRLFYEQGYENTTVDDIVELSGTSKGSFYHYFEGKDALLSSLSILFDEKYEELTPRMDPEMNSFDKLMYLNRELFSMIERTVPIDLLARMYSTQLVTREKSTCWIITGCITGFCAASCWRARSGGRSTGKSPPRRLPSSTPCANGRFCTIGVSVPGNIP